MKSYLLVQLGKPLLFRPKPSQLHSLKQALSNQCGYSGDVVRIIQSMYVAIENVQVVNADLSKTMVVGTAHTSVNMENFTNESFVRFSASYSAFKALSVPQGSGILKGIASTWVWRAAIILILTDILPTFKFRDPRPISDYQRLI